jgi:hypothetical protein
LSLASIRLSDAEPLAFPAPLRAPAVALGIAAALSALSSHPVKDLSRN